MGKRDPRFDAYIARSPDFARPILTHLRTVVHEACPDVEEAMKWSFPNFLYKGMFCSMAVFKEHCTFRFWKGELVLDARGRSAEKAMGQFGRITKLTDLPSKRVLTGCIKTAMKLNDEGVKPPWLARRQATKPRLAVPADLAKALKGNAKACATFEKFTPGHKREYIVWITEAKREETRKRRLETAIAWMADGKTQNGRYERK